MKEPLNKFTLDLIGSLEKRSKLSLIILGLLFVILQSFVDYASGDFSLLIFDLAPVAIVAWFAGRWPGVFISFASATSWFIVDIITTPSHFSPFVHYWNFIVKFIFFVITAHILLKLKKMLLYEKEQARVDYLTGVLNSMAFREASLRELNISRRYRHPITLAYMDLDNFKLVNDRFGHNAGDSLLRLIAQAIKNNLRSMDIVARMGGDEFVILMPETGYESAVAVINRIKDMLLDIMQQKDWPVTFSIGVATYLKPADSVDGMLRKADILMYEAKNSGKNTVKYEALGGNL
jgi:diguanylate cyclase (GGDEF)-like protein